MRDEVRTLIYPLPSRIRAYTARIDGYYTIIINDNLSPEARIEAYNHEMKHIYNNDFESEKSVKGIELKAHRGTS